MLLLSRATMPCGANLQFTHDIRLYVTNQELRHCDSNDSKSGDARGPEGLEILVIGVPNLGETPREDVEGQRDWWAG